MGYNLIRFGFAYHAQVFNYGMRYVLGDGPPRTQQGMKNALLAAAEPTKLQTNFGRIVDEPGFRIRRLGKLNPCKVK